MDPTKTAEEADKGRKTFVATLFAAQHKDPHQTTSCMNVNTKSCVTFRIAWLGMACATFVGIAARLRGMCRCFVDRGIRLYIYSYI